MTRPFTISAVSLLLATDLLAVGAQAAEWHAPSMETRGSTSTLAARAYLDANQTTLSLTTVSLEDVRVVGAGPYRTVRYVQRHHGLRVLGGQAAVRVRPDGGVRVAVLDVARELTVGSTPSVSEADAVHVAAAHTGLVKSAGRAELIVVPGNGGWLVWQVDVPSLDGGTRVFVDAHDGRVLEARPLALHAAGRVYPVSSVTTPETEDMTLVDLVPSTPQLLNGWNGNLAVTNYVSGDSQTGNYVLDQTLQPNVGEDFLYDPPTDTTDPADGFAQVGIYYHLTRMRDYFTTVHGLDQTGPVWKLVAIANAKEGGEPLDNAFYSPYGINGPFSAPNLIAIGQGASFDFAEDSDVFNHEFTHYVTGNAIDYNAGSGHADTYGRSPFSAAIDEGLSDYFASTVNGDPILGEASLARYGQERDLSDTAKACPADMNGESHDDGEIIGSFAWSLRDAFGPEIADALVWNAATLLTFGASFGDFGRGVTEVAAEMIDEGSLDASAMSVIEDLLAARGLDECFPELPLRAEEPRELFLRRVRNCEESRAEGRSRQSMFHYTVTPGAEAAGILLDVALTPELGEPVDNRYNIYVRKGLHVAFNASFPPSVTTFDHVLEGVTTPAAQLTIDAASIPPFEPNTTYHVVITHQNCGSANALLATSDIEPVVPEPPAPTPTPETDDGDVTVSCACRTPGGSQEMPVAPWALLGLGLLAARRRRS